MTDDTLNAPPPPAKGGGFTYGPRRAAPRAADPPPMGSPPSASNVIPFPAQGKKEAEKTPSAGPSPALLVKKVKGVQVLVYIDLAGEPVEKEPGRWVHPLEVYWRIEGLSDFTPREQLFASRDLVMNDPQWREKAFQSLKNAILLSLETPLT